MTNSSLQARAERRGLVREPARAPIGSPAVLNLKITTADFPQASIALIPAALALKACGLTTLRAQRALEHMRDNGSNVVELPHVEDVRALIATLHDWGIEAVDCTIPDAVDVKAVRDNLRLTQDQFARKYHFEIRTLQNWEQGKSAPDAATRAYLQVIAQAPGTVGRVLGRPRQERLVRQVFMMQFYRQTPGDCCVPVMPAIEETLPEAGVALADTLLAYFSDTTRAPAERPHTACLVDAHGSVPFELTVRGGEAIEITRGRRPDHAITRAS